jgi:diketogulonate reductase-like aldo/keto reductase
LANKKGCGITQIALAWVAAQGFIAIPGTTKPHRLEENFASREISLSEEEKAEIRELLESAKTHGERFNEAGQKMAGN